MNKIEIQNITLQLLEYIEKEKFSGYDPYDFYLSPISKYIPKSILFLHVAKVFPINMRPLLGIKKGMVTKVHALMIDSYLNLYEITKEKKYLQKAEICYQNMLAAAVLNTKEELGWGRNYPFKTGGEIHDNKKPLVYLNARLGQAMLHLYDINRDKQILNDLERVVRNIIRMGRVLEHDGWKFIGYSSDKNTRLTFNVSIVAVETIMKFMNRIGLDTFMVDDYEMRTLCVDIIRTIIHYQEPDGEWIYGYSATGKLFNQKDFHQGFIIDSLYECLPLIKDGQLRFEAQEAYIKGYEYLKNTLIDDKGAFFWRYPKKFPIDIHNQAQGVLSMSINKEDRNSQKLSAVIEYTIDNFWNKNKHCFKYQKWPLFTNKISYIRWCNGWMLYALTMYLKQDKSVHTIKCVNET